MDYEKLYKEALERASKYYNANTNKGYREIFEDIFHEFKESEDERIRKEIISFITDRKNWFPKDETKASWIAWLEKQGENELEKYINDERNKKDFYCEGKEMSWNKMSLDVRKHDYPYYFKGNLDCYPFNVERQGEQKPIIIIPKFKVGDIIKPKPYNEEHLIKDINENGYVLDVDIIIPFKDEDVWEIVEQKSDWSEEDEQNLQFWLDNNKSIDSDKRNWLKSLKDRVQPQPNYVEQDTETHDLWVYIREWNDKFGRLPKDEDELAACIDYVMKRQKAAWSEKHIADVFEKVGLAKIVREQGNDQLTNAVQSAMIELSKTAGGFVWKKI